MRNQCVAGAGLQGLLAIGFGAFGAHALKQVVASLPPEEAARRLAWVDTGSKYQLAHAAALLALAALWPALSSRPRNLALAGFFWGPLLFSASLYAMALGGPLWLGALTPVGGTLMLSGWAALIWAGLRRHQTGKEGLSSPTSHH
jgi:uncharacterized membrane protein YgdD (TMEM256/DUF423 family)